MNCPFCVSSLDARDLDSGCPNCSAASNVILAEALNQNLFFTMENRAMHDALIEMKAKLRSTQTYLKAVEASYDNNPDKPK